MSRAMSFKMHNVGLIFDNLSKILKKLNFTPAIIWNIDETGITMAQKHNNVAVLSFIRQIGRITTADIGSPVTIALGVTATGTSVSTFSYF